ncbi:MAG: hypothetical protein ONB30_06840 [candidate division KSB1 bacterium]|nr:hypothetical protein [candidate division KSB1 bacterium]
MSWLRLPCLRALLACAVALSACHAGRAGSVYSSKGIGLWRIYPGSQGAAMGGVGIALTDNLSINLRNPAARFPAGFTRVFTDASFDFSTISTKYGNARLHFAQANSFSMLVPLGSRISLSAILGPASEVRYAVSDTDTLPGYLYWREVTGRGGLSRGELAVFVKPSNYLYLGVSAQLYFGRIQETWKTTFSSTDFTSAHDRFSTHLQGFGGTVGVLARPTSRLALGAVLTPGTDLDAATDIRHAFVGADTSLTRVLHLPVMWGVGASYQWPFGLTLAVDYYRQEWGAVERSPDQRYSCADAAFLMVGVEYVPSRKLSDPYLRKVAYRAGFRYGHVPVLTSGDRRPTEYVFTTGLGFPFFSFLGRVDLTYELILRGSESVDPARERVHRVLIGLGGAERWFQRQ